MSLAKFKARLAAKQRAKLEAVKLTDVWIRICAWGQVYHEAVNFEVDAAFCAALAAYLEWAAAHGHLPPVLRQHDEDGTNYGLVRGIEARDDGPYLQLGLHADVAARYKAGRLPYWSPHFEWEFPDPHRADEADPSKPYVWPVRLREMSFVSVPHLLNNPPVNIALAGAPTTKSARVMCAAPPTGDKKMLTPEEIQAIADAVAPAVIAKLKAEMADDSEVEMAAPPAEEPPVAPMGAEPPKDGSAVATLSAGLTKLTSKVDSLAGENKTLKVQLAAQERKAAEAEVATDLVGVTLEPDEVKSLVSLKLSSDPEARKAYGVAVKGHRAAAGAAVSVELGAMGSAAQLPRQAGKVKAAALAAKTAKIEMGAPLLKHLREQGIDHRQFSDADWAELDEAYGLKI